MSADLGIRGPVALPGESTPDGVVVPAPAGASPATLGLVAVGVGGLAATVSGGVVLVAALGGWVLALALATVLVALVGTVLVVGVGYGMLRPDGLRVGSRDVALLRGGHVVWRRGLHEIDRVELSAGEEYLRLFTVDGEVRGASLGSLWDQPGAARAVASHLASAVERAHRSPEALADPDARLVALVGSVRAQG